MLVILSEDDIRTARVKGLREIIVIYNRLFAAWDHFRIIIFEYRKEQE